MPEWTWRLLRWTGLVTFLLALFAMYSWLLTTHQNWNWAARCRGQTLDTCDYVKDKSR